MKTNKIKVELSLNKTTINELDGENDAAGVPGTIISWYRVQSGNGKLCRTKKTRRTRVFLIFGTTGDDFWKKDDC